MITEKEILTATSKYWDFNFGLADNIYAYGSRVYGTEHPDSDYDYIVVADIDQDIIETLENVTIYSRAAFQKAIDEHEISVLECLFLPADKVLKRTLNFRFDLNLPQLRHSISKKASNSWVKCKKKLTVEKDFDAYAGKKSLWHSLRIISFGTQIALNGKIENYDAINRLYSDIVHNPSCDWVYYKKAYKPLYNQMMTEFRKLAPKRTINENAIRTLHTRTK